MRLRIIDKCRIPLRRSRVPRRSRFEAYGLNPSKQHKRTDAEVAEVMGYTLQCRANRLRKPSDTPRHLGVIIGIVILFIMLPAIIMVLWIAMSFGQPLGVATMFVAIIFLPVPRQNAVGLHFQGFAIWL